MVRRKQMSDINVVPYIDVMLVLLIIFMVTAPLLTQGIEVQLPESAAEAMANSEEPITLTINAKGQYFLDIGTDQAKPLSDDELVRRIGAVMHNQQKKLVLVKGDKHVDYGRVDWALGLLQEAGATNIGFASEALNRKKADNPDASE